ncbi:hypothetical protein KY361_03530 [Candidatus Woesearchaeota archaeon]|nr:hypothetical protein [Candidatus Woesearchaeota archaeon]
MAKKKKSLSKLGSWLFILGVIAAVVIGLTVTDITKPMTATLIVIGLIVGLANIKAKEPNPFFIAAISLVIVATLGKDALGALDFIGRILDAIVLIIGPAIVMVALKVVHALAKG